MTIEHVDETIRLAELARTVEALVFGADEPVQTAQIASIHSEVHGTERPSAALVQKAVDLVNGCYEQTGSVLRLRNWAGGLRMTTTPDVAAALKAFFRSEQASRLTRPLMETLAIVAYRQPVTKPEADHVRGVDSDYALRKLLDLGLVDIVGRADSVGRPILYGTTRRFLEEFGLAELGQLPNLREIEELLQDPSFSHERARLLMLRGLDAEPDATSEDS